MWEPLAIISVVAVVYRINKPQVTRRHYQRLVTERQRMNPAMCRKSRVYLVR